MRRNFFVIANPGAGLSLSPLVQTVTAALRDAGTSITTVQPNTFEAARQAAHEAAQGQRYDAIVAAGGDGTIHQVAAALLGSDVPLGIIPHGTGNVLAHEIGLRPEPSAIVRMLLEGPTTTVQCGYANREPFLLMAGAGFDGRVIAAVDHRFKSYVGKVAYAAPVLGALAHPIDSLDVTVDGIHHEASWAVIANARHYGGRFVLAPRHGIHRRGLQAVLFTAKTRAERLGQLLSLVMGKLDERAATHDDVRMLPCARATITARVPVPAQIDGDAFGTTPLEIESGAEELRLVLPDIPPTS
jgi:diacylglycerol kinase (ATP)